MVRKGKYIYYLIAVLALLYLPVLIVVVYSFNSSKDFSGLTGFTFQWYKELAQDENIIDALKTSLMLGLLSCVISAVVGTLGAIGMVRTSYKANKIVESISLIPLILPEIILGMAFLAVFSFVDLPFGMFTLVLGHVSFCVPYIFILVKSRLMGYDKSIREAALDLGAGELRVAVDITLPLIAPAVISGMLLSFAMSMDDVIISFFANGPTTNTLPIAIFSQMKVGVTPEINALSTLILGFTFLVIAVQNLISRSTVRRDG